MALDDVLARLKEEKARLQGELQRVVRMIRAAGKGAQAALKQYGQQRTSTRGARIAAPLKKARKLSQGTIAKMKRAQRERRKREKREVGSKDKRFPTSVKRKPAAPEQALSKERKQTTKKAS
jgi:hypothetical protein